MVSRMSLKDAVALILNALFVRSGISCESLSIHAFDSLFI